MPPLTMGRTMAAPVRILGFPVHIRSGFVLFMVLIVFLYGDEYGLYLALSIAGFTLLHELGHAVAARRAGATAEISLEFMAGYAAYEPGRPISRPMQAGIAFAGPAVHVAAGCALLLALGANPLDVERAGFTTLQDAVWWAGPAIGAFNLIPVLPLDGGNIVTSLLELATPTRARHIMVYVSLALTIGAIAWITVTQDRPTFTIFLGLILLFQVQALVAERDRTRVSPWQKAAAARRSGDPDRARRILTKALRRPTGANMPPGPLDDADVHGLVALLDRPLPAGDPWNEYVLANVLVRAGEHDEAARYAAASFERSPQPLMAATVARAAAALGDGATAVSWLRAAARAGTASAALASIIDQAPELATVRTHPEVVALRGALTAAN